jgi:flagellar biosynthesis/type III secretory pathway M-ring protein FliF/YscJ
METILILAGIAVLGLVLLVAILPRARARRDARARDHRRQELAGRHRAEAESRHARAGLAEKEAQRARAEAELHEQEAELHERGLVDDERGRRFERGTREHEAETAPRR